MYVHVALAGCATPAPETVRVPVPTPCVSAAPARPTTTTDAQLGALDDYAFVLSLALDRRALLGYAAELEALVEACR